MKFTSSTFVAAALFVASASALSIPVKRAVDPALIPDLGFSAGVNPTGTGDCDGAVKNAAGQAIKIPCSCPPDRAAFVAAVNANVAAGKVVNNPGLPFSFPTDNSKASQLARNNAASTTLQNLRGPGVGCPIVATTLQAQAAAIQAQPGRREFDEEDDFEDESDDVVVEKRADASPAQVAQLAPNLGFKAGLNPTGTGDCDGAVKNAAGQAIKIPCSCPPSQADFVKALQGNVGAGFAVNNPSVKVPFPTDNSKASQISRLNAGLITLQNLNGPGKGCPAVASTFQAQQKALQ